MTNQIHDVVTIGAGPASLSCAIYTTREDLETLMLEKGVPGGLVATTDSLENYPGFPEPIGGLELADRMRKQADRFGAQLQLAEVTSITEKDGLKILETTDGEIRARAVLIATGSDYKKLGTPGEMEYYGRGVHYCATCDGAIYRDKKLIVVGGGNSAAQEALYLTKFASHIDVLIRGDRWKAQDTMIKKIEENDKIDVHFNLAVEEITGEQLVDTVKAKNSETEETINFEVDGVFVFIGLVPNTKFIDSSTIELDEYGFVKTDDNLETSMKGVFCAGDVRSGTEQQAAIATGEGVLAALRIRNYLEAQE